jgi:iron complex transport system substrate-binding protein
MSDKQRDKAGVFRLAAVISFFLCLAAPLSGNAAKAPQRVISLAPNVTEVLYDLGLGDKVIAVSTYCNYPPAVRSKPRIGGMSNPSLETIIALRPDAVILTDDGNPREIAERLRTVGIPTHVFRARRLRDLPREIRALGAALGVPAMANRRAARIEQTMERYRRKALASKGISPKVLFIVQPEPLMVVGPETAIDDVLTVLGLRNIAAGTKNQYPRYSLEEVLRQSPDVIFLAQSHGDMAVHYRRLLKKLGHLEAVRRGRVYYIGDTLLRLGPRITEGIGEIARHIR